MKISYISAIAVMTLCGCSAIRQAQTTEPKPVVTAQVTEKPEIILYPEGSENIERKLPEKIKERPTQQPTPGADSFEQTTPQPSSLPKSGKFSESETRDVRIKYNAITNNVVNISLDHLANEFCYPYPGKVISNYGSRGRSMHTGVDIKAVRADTIRAAFAGVVRMSKPYSGYGNIVVIRHENGLETVYSHNLKNLVGINDVVSAGTPVALAGRTGRATTEHLHFETRINGQHFNPNLVLDCENKTINKGTLQIERRGDKIYARSGSSRSTEVEETQPSRTQYADITPAKPITQESAPARIITEPKDTQPSVHIVAPKDTLSSIARRYGTTVANLCKINKIDKDAILSLRQKIKLR